MMKVIWLNERKFFIVVVVFPWGIEKNWRKEKKCLFHLTQSSSSTWCSSFCLLLTLWLSIFHQISLTQTHERKLHEIYHQLAMCLAIWNEWASIEEGECRAMAHKIEICLAWNEKIFELHMCDRIGAAQCWLNLFSCRLTQTYEI
jgi:hypothetical protein